MVAQAPRADQIPIGDHTPEREREEEGERPAETGDPSDQRRLKRPEERERDDACEDGAPTLPLAKLEANESHVEALNAFAHLTRLQVFFFLARAKREVSVSDIQEAVEVPGPTLSHHLDVLRRAGLVESRRHERYIYYSVQRETVTALVRLLTACC